MHENKNNRGFTLFLASSPFCVLITTILPSTAEHHNLLPWYISIIQIHTQVNTCGFRISDKSH